MLSASPIRGSGNYYVELAHEDYFSEGGEPPGKWLGGGIDMFKLPDQTVRAEKLKAVLSGFCPRTSKPLVMNAGKKGRQRGHDFTFSAPKSVSLVWAAADRKTQRCIQRAQDKAVRAAIDYLEKHATFTRRGKQGVEVERAQLIVAAYEHSTSRRLDPNLHTHCLIANICARFDGSTGTLHGQVKRDADGKVIETFNALYRNKMAAGAIYRMELAHQLVKELGLEIVRAENGFSFEVAGISNDAIRNFSKRRAEIEHVMDRLGVDSAQAAEVAALDTRTSKDQIHRPQLMKQWGHDLKPFGITAQSIRENCYQRSIVDQAEQISQTIDRIAVSITAEKGSCEIKELYERAAVELQPLGVSWSQLDQAIEKELIEGKLVSLGVEHSAPHVSMASTLQLEHRFDRILEHSKNDQRNAVSYKIVNKVLSQNSRSLTAIRLSREQSQAVRYLTRRHHGSYDGIRVMTGDAGSGKTTVLQTAKKVWERAGYRVVGAALAGKAARELDSRAGIKADTISKWNYQLDKGVKESVAHHARMLARSAIGKHTWKPNKEYTLDRKTVLVIDEAAMADTPQLLKLMDHARQAKAQVILVGDDKQCQAIEHGGAFSMAANKLGSFRLTENWRQRDSFDRDVSKLFAEGNAGDALRKLAGKGRLSVARDSHQAFDSLIKDWQKHGARRPDKNLVLVATHEQRRSANARCQQIRLGTLRRSLGASLVNHEGQRLYRGDRVHFRESLIVKTQKNREKIPRGTFGKITGVSTRNRSWRIKLDDGRELDIPCDVMRRDERKRIGRRQQKSKAEIALGYAVTTHASQGATIDRAFVLAGGSMQDRELTYVQATRAKIATRFYTTEQDAGKELTEIARKGAARQRHAGSTKDLSKRDCSERSMLAKQMSTRRHKQFGLAVSEQLDKQRQQSERDREERMRSR